jgi:hypothetical protein
MHTLTSLSADVYLYALYIYKCCFPACLFCDREMARLFGVLHLFPRRVTWSVSCLSRTRGPAAGMMIAGVCGGGGGGGGECVFGGVFETPTWFKALPRVASCIDCVRLSLH